MVCLVVEQSADVRNGLCLLLLDFGVLGLGASRRTDALEILARRTDIAAAIVDVDNRDVEAPRLLAELKPKGVRCVAHTVSREVRAELSPLVDGVLPKPFDPVQTAAALRGLFAEQALAGGEHRQHMRVAPQPAELLRASFRITADSRLYSGRVRNISVGGAAIEVYKGPPDAAIRVGWRIPRLEFNLGATPLTPAAVIVLYKRRLIAVRFESMSPAERSVLARYVYGKLTAG
jgi:hypothetical protein